MKLLNGNTIVRQRNSEGCAILKCGCAHTDVMWVQMCTPCYATWETLHEAGIVGRKERALREEFT
jgi:hypothetical protein